VTDGDWPVLQAALGLSARELEVARHILHGDGEARIAYLLGISAHTVHTYVKRTYAKLGVSSQRELIMRILEAHFSAAADRS
jgi:DNA-binding CsgD family transcriptional regulator